MLRRNDFFLRKYVAGSVVLDKICDFGLDENSKKTVGFEINVLDFDTVGQVFLEK